MPFFIAYDSANDRMYATNFGSSTASAIDTTSNTVIDTDPSTSEIDPITVGTRPVGIAYDSINENMYMTNFGDFPGSVSVIDTTTNTVIDTDPSTSEIDPIAVGSLPTDIAYDPINQDIYVTNQGSGSVSVIDTTTNTEIETITVGDTPIGIDYDPINHRMYVTNSMDGTVSVINLCPRPELQQQSTNDIIMTTANNNNDHTIIADISEQKEQKIIEQQNIQKSNLISPPSLPTKKYQ
jgi:YVTN family beta-propeller protein